MDYEAKIQKLFKHRVQTYFVCDYCRHQSYQYYFCPKCITLRFFGPSPNPEEDKYTLYNLSTNNIRQNGSGVMHGDG